VLEDEAGVLCDERIPTRPRGKAGRSQAKLINWAFVFGRVSKSSEKFYPENSVNNEFHNGVRVATYRSVYDVSKNPSHEIYRVQRLNITTMMVIMTMIIDGIDAHKPRGH